MTVYKPIVNNCYQRFLLRLAFRLRILNPQGKPLGPGYLTVDRPRNRNYKIRKFKNTYTQDNKQLFQIIGQIHSAML